MSIAELKQLIADLPDDMPVIMPNGDDTFITVCKSNSEVILFDKPDDIEDDDSYFGEALVLVSCTCHIEDLPVVPSEQILN